MRWTHKASAALFLGLFVPCIATAADLPIKAPITKAPAMHAPAWTGFYIGGNFGYGWGNSTGNDLTVYDPHAAFGSGPGGYAALGGFQYPSVTPDGVIGGGQIGYNFQSGSIVWGIVADFQASDMKDDQTVDVPALTVFSPENQSHSAKIDWFGTLRGRIGYAVGNFLPYISGGLAYGRVESSLSTFLPSTNSTFATGSTSTTKVGWTIGGGIEYALPDNWTLGVDYLYFDLGHETVTATSTHPALPLSIAMDQHFAGNVVRATVNYKF